MIALCTFARRRLAPTVLAVFSAASPLRAQDVTPVTGRVPDSLGRPLSGVGVEVLGSLWTAASGRDGRFRLRLPAGTWSLRLMRIGYRPDTLEIRVRGGPDPVAIEARLRAAPIRLRGLSVEAPRAPPLSQTVTTETVRQVPPLGEPDVFRAVVLLPGIAQPNDLKGRIHLAGGASDETGVRLDGHPRQVRSTPNLRTSSPMFGSRRLFILFAFATFAALGIVPEAAGRTAGDGAIIRHTSYGVKNCLGDGDSGGVGDLRKEPVERVRQAHGATHPRPRFGPMPRFPYCAPSAPAVY